MKAIFPSPELDTKGGHYSPGVQAGDFLFVSGQTSRDAQRKIIGSTIEEQTRVVMANVRNVLEAAGGSLENIVKTTVHLANLEDQSRFNDVYSDYFPKFRPARTTVGSQLNQVLVGIDVIAYMGKNSKPD